MKKRIALALIIALLITSLPPARGQAQTILNLPEPGVTVPLSQAFEPVRLKGIQLSPDNHWRFNFLVDKGDARLSGEALKDEITRLSKYFLTALTVPENDLWVNLSPYEKDRVIPTVFGITQMGKDLLEQDYLLKQLVASLSHPQLPLGKKFWQTVYLKAGQMYGTTQIPTASFNKVWIVPQEAEVYIRGNSAFVARSALDVLLDADFLAVQRNSKVARATEPVYSGALRELLLPELRREVNEGRHFGVLRQVFDAMILAAWYKRHLRSTMLSQMYVRQNKVEGINAQDRNIKEKIFNRYLEAFKRRVYNFIQEDFDPITQQKTARKYVSGGFSFSGLGLPADRIYREQYSDQRNLRFTENLAMASVNMALTGTGGKFLDFPDRRTLTKHDPLKKVPEETRNRAMRSTLASLFSKLSLAAILATGGVGFSSMTAEQVMAAASNQGPKAQVKRAVKKKSAAPAAFKSKARASAAKPLVSRPKNVPPLSAPAAPDKTGISAEWISFLLSAGVALGFLRFPWKPKAVTGPVAKVSPSLPPEPPKVDSKFQSAVPGVVVGQFRPAKVSNDELAEARQLLSNLRQMRISQSYRTGDSPQSGKSGAQQWSKLAMGLAVGVPAFLMQSMIDSFLSNAGVILGCGIIGYGLIGPWTKGRSAEWTAWLKEGTEELSVRGGQSIGLLKWYRTANDVQMALVKKIKTKRGVSRGGFYNNLVDQVYRRYEKMVPPDAQLLYNYGHAQTDIVVGHVRYATLGELEVGATHPHTGQVHEDRITMLNAQGAFEGVSVNSNVAIAENGDNVAYRFFERRLNFNESRKLFSGLMHFKVPMAKGDAPLLAAQIQFHTTQGSFKSSARIAHVLVNHVNAQEAMDDLLTEQQERVLGDYFDRLSEQPLKLLSRPDLQIAENRPKNNHDLWVTAGILKERPDLKLQYALIQEYKAILKDEMKLEAGRETQAGVIFKSWEERWRTQGRDADQARERFIDLLVEKFFTGDRKQATQEWYERAVGTFGIFVSSTYKNDGVTLLCKNQDVAAGISPRHGVFSFASDSRSIKHETADGKRMEYIIHLKNDQVVDISNLNGTDFWVQISARDKNGWKEVFHDETKKVETILKREFYPNQQSVNGIKNPYYTPVIKYRDKDKIIDEDREMTARLIREAHADWHDPESFNRRSLAHLAKRLLASQKALGKARLLIVAYENSFWMSQVFERIVRTLVPEMSVSVVDANDFIMSPREYQLDKQTVALVVSKSGATFPTRLAADVLQRMVGRENVFGMTGRIDSMLSTALGQELYPEAKFTRRIFLAGNFYPSEAQSISEELLAYNQIQMAFRLALYFQGRNKHSDEPDSRLRIRTLLRLFEETSMQDARRIKGFDDHGNKLQGPVQERLSRISKYLGRVQRESYVWRAIYAAMVLGVFELGGPLTTLMVAGGGLPDSSYKFLVRALDFGLVMWMVPFMGTNLLRYFGIHRPLWGRLHAPNLYLGAPFDGLPQAQEAYFSKLFANSLASIGLDVYSANNARDMMARLPYRAVRGDQVLSFIPDAPTDPAHRERFLDDPNAYSVERETVQMSLQQFKFPRTGSIFGLNFLRAGVEVTTFGRGPFNNPAATNQHVDIGGAPAPPLSSPERKIYDMTTGLFAALMVFKEIGAGMVKTASFGYRLWKPWETYSRTQVHTTASSVPAHQGLHDILSEEDLDAAQMVRASPGPWVKGGIDLAGTGQMLNEKTDHTALPVESMHPAGIAGIAFSGITPQVVEIKAVTPVMLEALLGQPALSVSGP